MKIMFSLTPSLHSYAQNAQQLNANRLMSTEVEYAARVVARTAMYLLELGMPMPDMEAESEEQKATLEEVLFQVRSKLEGLIK